jgi:hypothetical protein
MIPPHRLGRQERYSYECGEMDIHSVQLRSVRDKQVREIHTFHSPNCTLKIREELGHVNLGSTERIISRPQKFEPGQHLPIPESSCNRLAQLFFAACIFRTSNDRVSERLAQTIF